MAIQIAQLFDELRMDRAIIPELVDVTNAREFTSGDLVSVARALACARVADEILVRDVGDLGCGWCEKALKLIQCNQVTAVDYFLALGLFAKTAINPTTSKAVIMPANHAYPKWRVYATNSIGVTARRAVRPYFLPKLTFFKGSV